LNDGNAATFHVEVKIRRGEDDIILPKRRERERERERSMAQQCKEISIIRTNNRRQQEII
jgi:hypothetical protein